MNCAFVTGGSRGIGKAICIRLAAMGFHVIVHFKSNQAQAEDTLATIVQQGGTGELIAFDVSDKKQVADVLGAWISAHPDHVVQVLVNNAGIKDDVLLMMMKDEQWENVLRTNLDSFFYVTRLLITGMVYKRYGRVINVVSLSGIKGLPGQTNYSAAKGGVIAATKALAQEVGRRNITVNAVAPGFITTEMTQHIPEKEMKALIPANRFGTPEEVAFAVGFLASPEAGYINGEVLSINGGLYT